MELRNDYLDSGSLSAQSFFATSPLTEIKRVNYYCGLTAAAKCEPNSRNSDRGLISRMNDAARECPTEVAKELEQIGRRGSLTVYAGQKLFYKKSDTHKLLLLSLINLYTIHS